MTSQYSFTPGTGGLLARAAPLGRRLRTDAGGAGLLLAATIAALLWANLPFGESYEVFWHTEIAIRLGGAELALDLRHWVNDGLMAFFFYVVGLEVKRELVLGELADRRRAAVPALAALGGLALPALVYVAFNLGDEAAAAWGVVISTDTAFLVGLLALLGPACPPQLRVFLLALAIGDDVGALTVIALFYTEDLAVGPLALAVLGVGLMYGLRWLKVWRGPAYLVLAAAAWVALYASGVHPTLLGVTIALITPAYTARRGEVADAGRRTRAYLQSPNPQFAHAAQLAIARSVPSGQRQYQLWHPWTTAVFVPLFALANAGVELTGQTLLAATTSTITLGIVAGLVLGKLVGIVGGTELAVRSRLGGLAPGLTRAHLVGGAAMSGIGFTISLFIVDLAFDEQALADQARVGVLAASVLAALLGTGLLRLTARRRPDEGRDAVLDPPVDPERDHVRGPVDAPLTLVEYADFDCPFCAQATGAIEDLRERLGDQLRYVFRHAPLDDVHPRAQLAAEAAEAAADQGRFWDMYDRLFTAQDRHATTDLLEHAGALGLDVGRFSRQLGSGLHTRRVTQDVESARASGVPGTPTFFIGGRRHTGPFDADTLARALLTDSEDDATTPVPAQPGTRALPLLGMRDTGQHQQPDEPLPDLPEDIAETPERGGDHPRLTDEQLARLEQVGPRLPVARGDTLYRVGDDGYDWYVVLSGAVAVIGHRARGQQPTVRVHGARRFLGELDLLRGAPVERTALVVRDGVVLRLTLEQLKTIFADDPELRDLVLRAYLVRRAIGFELSVDLRILGRSDSADTHRLQQYAAAHDLTSDVVELGTDGGGERLMTRMGVSEPDLPVVVTRAGQVLHNPDDADLDRAL